MIPLPPNPAARKTCCQKDLHLPFRFVHTADLHLDSPLKSLGFRDPALAETVGVATRTALTRIVDLCLAEAVDALIVAGDLYDGAQVSMKTARFLAQELQRLDAAGIRTFVIRGNHDAMSRITRELVLPPSVTVFGAKPSTVRFDLRGDTVAVHGLSFAQPQAPESLLPRYPAPLAGAINIGLMHTSLNGSPTHDVYAPCAVADLDAAGYDYWALGHIHVRAVHQGRASVVMPGIPQGRDIGEAGAKSVTLAEVSTSGVRLEARSVAAVRFDRAVVDVAGLSDWPALVDAVTGALHGHRGRDGGADHLVLRLVLTGATPLGWRVRRDLDLVREQAALVAEGIGSVWIDKLEDATDPDGAPTPGLPDDLAAALAGLAADPAIRAQADQAIDDVLKALPRDLRGMLGDDPASVAAARDALLRDGAALVLSHLAAREDR